MIKIELAEITDLNRIMEITRACAIDLISKNIFQWNEKYPSKEAFKKDNVKLQTLCDYSYLLSAALNKKTISENQLEDLKTWRNNPSNWTPKED